MVTRHDIHEEALLHTGLSSKTRALEFSVLNTLPPAYVDLSEDDVKVRR
jgi:hypothetical protein